MGSCGASERGKESVGVREVEGTMSGGVGGIGGV